MKLVCLSPSRAAGFFVALLAGAVLTTAFSAPQSSSPSAAEPTVISEPAPAAMTDSAPPAVASKPLIPPTPDSLNPASVPSPPSIVPERWPESRYEDLREHSPFALATAAVLAPAPEHNFAEGLKLKGVGYSLDKDGKTIASVWVQSAQSAANKVEFELDGTEPGTGDGAGISVTKINQSSEWGKTTVELKKGNELATVEYDQMAVEAAPAPLRPVRAGVYRPPTGAPAPGHPIPHPSPPPTSGPRIRTGASYPGTTPPGAPPPPRPQTRVIGR